MIINKDPKKIELVSPAGSYSQLVAAINAGADAVYLGFKKFSARAYADNFEFRQLKKAVKTAHEHGVRVYLTLNILIKDPEIEEVIHFLNEYLGFCRDGIIIQDLGLFRIISDLYPGTRLHASTQMNIHNLESVRFLKDTGFKRIVLAREMSLHEIANITSNCDIEIETFAHGSQCYSFSGNCYFSSFTGSRSGNRGRCTQPCRMKYDLAVIEQGPSGRSKSREKHLMKNSYILSKSDLCTLEIIPGLVSAGITALKIEGRMKTPEYVGIVTKTYRKYLDLYYKDPDNYIVDFDDINKIKQIFSREIGTGYYENSCPVEIVSFKKSGSIGNFLGRVIRFEKNHIYIRSGLDINKGDYLEIWTNRGNEQVKAGDFEIAGREKGKTIYKIKTDRKIRLNTGDRVFKFFDEILDREAKSLYVDGINIKKTPAITDFKLKSEEYSDLKLGSMQLKKYLEKSVDRSEQYKRGNNKKKGMLPKRNEINLSVEVHSLKDARLILDSGVRSIVINSFREVFSNNDRSLRDLVDINDIGKKGRTDIIIKTPHIIYYPELSRMKEGLVKLTQKGINRFSVSNTGLLKHIINSDRYKENGVGIYLSFLLNVFNHQTVLFFKELIDSSPDIYLKVIMPSAELTIEEIIGLQSLSGSSQYDRNKPFEFSVYGYGYFPVMISRYRLDYFYDDVTRKSIDNRHHLIDQKGYRFIVIEDYSGNLIFLNSRKICNFFDLPVFVERGIGDIYVDTRTFSGEQIQEIVGYYKSAADRLSKGQMAGFNEISRVASKSELFSNYTKGHFFRETI